MDWEPKSTGMTFSYHWNMVGESFQSNLLILDKAFCTLGLTKDFKRQ
jgi:hypothetical protein